MWFGLGISFHYLERRKRHSGLREWMRQLSLKWLTFGNRLLGCTHNLQDKLTPSIEQDIGKRDLTSQANALWATLQLTPKHWAISNREKDFSSTKTAHHYSGHTSFVVRSKTSRQWYSLHITDFQIIHCGAFSRTEVVETKHDWHFRQTELDYW